MSAEIIKPFGDYKTEGPQEGVVQTLKSLLARAEKGEITSLACSFQLANGFLSYAYAAGSGGYTALVASVAMLGYTIQRDWDQSE